MIVWSDKIKKANDIFKAVGNELLKQNIDLDGVIEIFNDGTEQGTLLKLYDKYNPEIDLCIWAYLPSERDCNNQMKVLIGHQSDCTKLNTWSAGVPYKIFTQDRAIHLHKEVRDYVIKEITTRLDKTIETK